MVTDVRRDLYRVLWSLIAFSLLLAALHWGWSDYKEGGVYWFNLDKERNLPTWFNGLVFALFGCAAGCAYYWERRINSERPGTFRLPWAWLGVAALGLAMSADDMLIIHENLFWKDVREASSQLGDSWKYVTQWQIVYSPAIVLAMGFLAGFFAIRYRVSPGSWRAAAAGMGMWITSIAVEGLRETFKNLSAGAYDLSVILEELCEMDGAVLLMISIAWYVAAIATDLNDQRLADLALQDKLANRKTVLAVVGMVVALGLTGAAIQIAGHRLAEQGAPVPSLIKRALED